MIPKVIHYCWFGRNPKPRLAEKCLASWRKYCPDYKIIEWNEDNFDIGSNLYVKQAYESKKWAFVTDVVRLQVLYTHGGIYMDTDIELIRPLDQLLGHQAFSGFEDTASIQTGIMASEKGHPLFKELLDSYSNRLFLHNGKPDLTTNVETTTKLLLKKGLRPDNTFQEIAGLAVYPNDFFCPMDFFTREIHLTKNSHAIHHFAGSWVSGESATRWKYNRRKRKIEAKWGNHAGQIYESFYYSMKKHGGQGLIYYFYNIMRNRIFR